MKSADRSPLNAFNLLGILPRDKALLITFLSNRLVPEKGHTDNKPKYHIAEESSASYGCLDREGSGSSHPLIGDMFGKGRQLGDINR
ncbi:hypothetical protein BB987_02215 [Photorhabdus temperata]|nr:hypothetical protein BB987_02215 [Photorhabdus temperata]